MEWALSNPTHSGPLNIEMPLFFCSLLHYARPKQRFHLTSRESGMIRATNSIAQMICTFPVSYFGGKGSKPKYLGVGVITIGIGRSTFRQSFD